MGNEEILRSIGERVSKRRRQLGITQEELAIQMQLNGMDMTQLMVSRIEKNQRHVVDGELLMLSRVLGVSMEWLCGDGEPL